jgi:hypothetical protein
MSNADKLKKIKELLDSGVLTEEESLSEKGKLLNKKNFKGLDTEWFEKLNSIKIEGNPPLTNSTLYQIYSSQKKQADLLQIIQNIGVHHKRGFNEWSLINVPLAMYNSDAFGYEILPKLLVYFALIDSVEDKILQQNALDEISKSINFLIGKNDETFLVEALQVFEESEYFQIEDRTRSKLEQNKDKFVSFIKQLTNN